MAIEVMWSETKSHIWRLIPTDQLKKVLVDAGVREPSDALVRLASKLQERMRGTYDGDATKIADKAWGESLFGVERVRRKLPGQDLTSDQIPRKLLELQEHLGRLRQSKQGVMRVSEKVFRTVFGMLQTQTMSFEEYNAVRAR